MEQKYIICIGRVTEITLEGRLDANSAPALMEELRTLIGNEIEKIVIRADNLEYISSAGLRAIIFAKQKVGADCDIYLIGAQQTVLDVISMSGLDNFLILQDTFVA